MRRVTLAFLLFAAAAFGGQDTAPDWVKEVATRTLPNYPPEVHTAQLLDESHVTVLPDGSTVEEIREAVRILTPEGKDRAQADIPYFKKVTKIREFKAWLLTADGSVKAYSKNDVADFGVQEQFELYADQRARMIRAQNAPVGSTFVWTAEIEDHPNMPEREWFFQRGDPALVSRLVLTLPAGWEAKAVTFNHEPIQPTVDGNTETWELKNLDYVKPEKNSPAADSIVPWLGLSYYETNNRNAIRGWRDFSIKESALDEPQGATSDELNAEVRQLTASAGTTLEKIRAISKFVQQLKYVAVETNLAHGGGSLPHPATQVFAKRYGDCKDKANLMRTMLRQIGVQSYMIVVYAGDRNHVRPEWPGDQFNHMILAVQAPPDVSLPAIMKHPQLGNLLIFDSTDPFTPLGLLPSDEQGSYGLLLAGDKGGAIQLPVVPSAANRTEVSVDGTLSAQGALDAKLTMKSRADEASELRALRELRSDEFERAMTGWLQHNVHELASNKMNAVDSFDSGEMEMHFDFTAPRYAQSMQGRMLVFRPAIVQPYHGFPMQAEKRQNPLVLDAESYHKEVHMKMPDGFKVDEMPDPASLTSSFGKYSSECKLTGNDLTFTEDIDITATTVPADHYKEAREFFGRVAGAERAPLVLVKN